MINIFPYILNCHNGKLHQLHRYSWSQSIFDAAKAIYLCTWDEITEQSMSYRLLSSDVYARTLFKLPTSLYAGWSFSVLWWQITFITAYSAQKLPAVCSSELLHLKIILQASTCPFFLKTATMFRRKHCSNEYVV